MFGHSIEYLVGYINLLLSWSADDHASRHLQICLDEAQMIEGKYTNAARMVQQLSASHRWCVTGTPLQQGVYGNHY